MHVLIVEDDLKTADLYKSVLKSFDCTISSLGSEAMVYIEEHLPEIIILDHKLPDIYGIEIAKWICYKYNPYIVLISGCISEIELKKNGYDKYFNKVLQKGKFSVKSLEKILSIDVERDFVVPRYIYDMAVDKTKLLELISKSFDCIQVEIDKRDIRFVTDAVQLFMESEDNREIFIKLAPLYKIEVKSARARLSRIRKKIYSSTNITNKQFLEQLSNDYIKNCGG